MAAQTGDEFRTYLSNLLRARFPLILLSTWEEMRALRIIKSIASDPDTIRTTRTVFTWKVTTGMHCDEKELSLELRKPMRALDFIETYDEPAIFVLQDFHIYLGSDGGAPDNDVVRKLRDIAPILSHGTARKNVILMSPVTALPVELQKDVTIVDLDLPDLGEMRNLLEDMIRINTESGSITTDLTDNEEEWLCKATLGLTLNEAENAFARAMVDDGRLDVADLDVIIQEKRQIIRKSGILEFIQTDLTMEDVGGLQNLKRWLKKRDKSWLETAKEYGLPSPKGVLLMGVPGCGKSLVCKAISDMWHLPLVRLDVGRVFSDLVGSSERNIREAIKVAEAMAPSVLWIDELEKGFSGLSNAMADSGTSNRVFATFLTWMQEKIKPVFVVATSNDIEALPSELLRKGRFDEIFFVDLPNRAERLEILRIHIAKRLKSPKATGDFKLTDEVLARLADLSEGFSGSEIEQAMISGLFDAFSEDRAVVFEDFERALSGTVTLSVTHAEHIKTLRDWAKQRAVCATDPEDPTLNGGAS